MNDDAGHITFPLAGIPNGSVLRSVAAAPATVAGRSALRVGLTERVSREGIPDVDYIDMPTFAVLPVEFSDGTIEADVFARLTPEAPDYARGFAGIAFHISGSQDRFEAVYLRPLNGHKENPPAPRDTRALQYFAYPDWKYQRLRDEYPDGRYEAGADIGAGEWIHLRMEVAGHQIKAFVNGAPALACEAKRVGAKGSVGLWVDIGTEAYFANLRITPASS